MTLRNFTCFNGIMTHPSLVLSESTRTWPCNYWSLYQTVWQNGSHHCP